MSLTAAIAEIRTRLNAISGLAEMADLRADTIEEAGKGNIDGAYNLRIVGTGNPWPDLELAPLSWWVQMELELATLSANDQVAAGVAEAARTDAIRTALHYTPLTNGTIWDFGEPFSAVSVNNPKLRVWRWRWKLRYTT